MIDRDGYARMSASLSRMTGIRCSGASGCDSTRGNFRKAAYSTARLRSRRCIASCTRSRVVAGACEDTRAYPRLDALRGSTELEQARVARRLRGQKQIWFLLRLVGRDCDVCLRACEHPEFDAWRWNDYWLDINAVIEFNAMCIRWHSTSWRAIFPAASTGRRSRGRPINNFS